MRGRSRTGSATNWRATGWKAVGLAGLLGVAATGVVIARAERRRAAYTPDEVRARLHARHAELRPEPAAPHGQ
jgi:hypothetical protein